MRPLVSYSGFDTFSAVYGRAPQLPLLFRSFSLFEQQRKGYIFTPHSDQVDSRCASNPNNILLSSIHFSRKSKRLFIWLPRRARSPFAGYFSTWEPLSIQQVCVQITDPMYRVSNLLIDLNLADFDLVVLPYCLAALQPLLNSY